MLGSIRATIVSNGITAEDFLTQYHALICYTRIGSDLCEYLEERALAGVSRISNATYDTEWDH